MTGAPVMGELVLLARAPPELPMPTPAEIKKALKEAGLEVYRTRGEAVHLAERVRENLLMDAQIFVRGGVGGEGSAASVGFVVRAQRTDFPNDGEEHLFDRARKLGEPAVARGYAEFDSQVRQILDPGDGERTIDVWCEVSFEKAVPDLDAAVIEARFALTIEKAAPATLGAASTESAHRLQTLR